MFQKVLIAEDFPSVNYSVQRTLEELGIAHNIKNHVYYCDHALARIQKALNENEPYELLITDLSFDDDATPQEIKDGATLIKAVKALQPDLKVLVFSIENRFAVAQKLFNELRLDGYVPKGRSDARDLQLAIETIYENKKHLSGNLKKVPSDDIVYDFTTRDIAIITQILAGATQKEIAEYLEKNNITPSGLSSIEKRLKAIKDDLNFNNNQQLIAYCKDYNII
ncbi:DNA-binding transcriptional response regulator [Pedobacter chitinilyticus]|uniref:Response regulator transcription factor n=1 Tax=Pedobacter chitinilyticus TaxID=2233776 RepID=A0A3S3PSK5_9SPHI|nr:response regulator transcription factor [Pedobacter chitinilyticus]RWU04877.1 response regulator transcription factor [Pedobacter chitinilyticus]